MIVAFLHYRYSQHLHTFFVRCVIILLMRAKCTGPARVNTQSQCECCTYRLQCTTYIKHIYFVHRFYIYQSIADYLYVQYMDYIYIYIGNTYVAYCVCSVYIVYSLYIINI